MSKQLDNSTAIRSEIKEMPERVLQGLKNGVGRGEDGRIVIGSKMDLKKLEPYVREGTGLVGDAKLLKTWGKFPAQQKRAKECEICGTLGIHGYVYESGKENKKLVIVSQGLSASRDCPSNQQLRRYLNELGMDVLCFDYYKEGKTGDVSLQKRVQDLTRIITAYDEKGYAIGGYGSSVGGSAMWVAASLLEKKGIQLRAIANRTIIADFPAALQREENRRRMSPESGVAISREEIKELEDGKFNLDKHPVGCPLLDVQGSMDTIAGMDGVRKVMQQIGQSNVKSKLVEIAGADHECSNPLHGTMQMYLLVSFLKKHMLDGKS